MQYLSSETQLHVCAQNRKMIYFYLGSLQRYPTTSEKGVNTSPQLLWLYDTTLHLKGTAAGAKG